MSANKNTSLWKGAESTYRPPAGTRCLLSGPNEDDENGYVFSETTILWCDETFVLYGNPGFWPQLYKWDHVIARVFSADQPPKEQP